jgi:hypothetical protein
MTTKALAVRRRRRKPPPSTWNKFKEVVDMLSFAGAFTIVTSGILLSMILTWDRGVVWFPFVLFWGGVFYYFFIWGGKCCSKNGS